MPRQFVGGQTLLNGLFASSQSVVIDTAQYSQCAIQAIYSNGTTAAKTFTTVSTTNDTATITAHGQVLGSVGQLTTTGGLPTGLSTSTNYFLIIVDANTVKFATSLANAVAGTAVDLTTAGTGTQTFTPTTAASNVLKLQSTCEPETAAGVNSNWVDISGMTATIATSATTAIWDLMTLAYGMPSYRWVRLLYTPSAGQENVKAVLNAWQQ